MIGSFCDTEHMFQDFLAAVAVSLMVAAGCVLAVGYLADPTPDARCPQCGEYVEDAGAARDHATRCSPCR